MALNGSQRLAVFLCKFTDSATIEPNPRAYYDDLFVNRGTGGLNDYWIAASLGAINLDGSQVFGWKTLDTTQADFVTDHPGRWDKIKGAIDGFPEVDMSGFTAAVALFNVSVNDGGSQNGVLGGPGDANVTFLAHEIGHVLGFDHSFDESDRVAVPEWPSTPGEYFDRFDIMSAMGVDSDVGHRFSPRGPLMNAANMDRVGWLPANRVWEAGKHSSDVYTVEIVALEHPEVGGYLAAKAGNWIAEFRMADGFDGGMRQPAVLFHISPAEPNSIIIASDPTTNNHEWLPGQVYWNAILFGVFGGTRVTIEGFDLARKTARLRIQVKAYKQRVAEPDILYRLGIGQLPIDGHILVIRNGKIVREPVPEPEWFTHHVRATLRDQIVDILEHDLAGRVQLRNLEQPGD